MFRDVLRTNNRDSQAEAGVGMAELALEDYRAARNAFRNVVRLNPSDQQSQRQLELVEQVTALDPNIVGLRASARYQRSVEVLMGVLHAEEQCLAASNDPDVDAARKALAHRPRRGEIDDAIEMNLDRAVRLWKAVKNLCPAQAQKSEALDRILARLSRQ